jgi:hypothetical protein
MSRAVLNREQIVSRLLHTCHIRGGNPTYGHLQLQGYDSVIITVNTARPPETFPHVKPERTEPQQLHRFSFQIDVFEPGQPATVSVMLDQGPYEYAQHIMDCVIPANDVLADAVGFIVSSVLPISQTVTTIVETTTTSQRVSTTEWRVEPVPVVETIEKPTGDLAQIYNAEHWPNTRMVRPPQSYYIPGPETE